MSYLWIRKQVAIVLYIIVSEKQPVCDCTLSLYRYFYEFRNQSVAVARRIKVFFSVKSEPVCGFRDSQRFNQTLTAPQIVK